MVHVAAGGIEVQAKRGTARAAVGIAGAWADALAVRADEAGRADVTAGTAILCSGQIAAVNFIRRVARPAVGVTAFTGIGAASGAVAGRNGIALGRACLAAAAAVRDVGFEVGTIGKATGTTKSERTGTAGTAGAVVADFANLAAIFTAEAAAARRTTIVDARLRVCFATIDRIRITIRETGLAGRYFADTGLAARTIHVGQRRAFVPAEATVVGIVCASAADLDAVWRIRRAAVGIACLADEIAGAVVAEGRRVFVRRGAAPSAAIAVAWIRAGVGAIGRLVSRAGHEAAATGGAATPFTAHLAALAGRAASVAVVAVRPKIDFAAVAGIAVAVGIAGIAVIDDAAAFRAMGRQNIGKIYTAVAAGSAVVHIICRLPGHHNAVRLFRRTAVAITLRA